MVLPVVWAQRLFQKGVLVGCSQGAFVDEELCGLVLYTWACQGCHCG
jgi:hypothetical protein